MLGSTYGRGSRVKHYGYGSSRPQDASAKQSVGSKGWGTLASTRTLDGENDLPRNYGATKETFLLTTINAEHGAKAKLGSPSGHTEGGSTGKSSLESNTGCQNGVGLRSIQVDTEVNVVQSHSPLDFSFENRRERKDMV